MAKVLGVAFLPALLCACIAPGSAAGHLQLSGHVEGYAQAGPPLRVEVVLARDYGLSELDKVFIEREKETDNGVDTVTVDPDGRFEMSVDSVYHVTWILPFAAFPRAPPPPDYFLAFTNRPREIYALRFKKDRAQVEVFEMPGRKPIPTENAGWELSGAVVKREDGKVEVAVRCREREHASP